MCSSGNACPTTGHNSRNEIDPNYVPKLDRPEPRVEPLYRRTISSWRPTRHPTTGLRRRQPHRRRPALTSRRRTSRTHRLHRSRRGAQSGSSSPALWADAHSSQAHCFSPSIAATTPAHRYRRLVSQRRRLREQETRLVARRAGLGCPLRPPSTRPWTCPLAGTGRRQALTR